MRDAMHGEYISFKYPVMGVNKIEIHFSYFAIGKEGKTDCRQKLRETNDRYFMEGNEVGV